MNYPNWFSMTAEQNFEKYLNKYKNKPITVLQIGVFVGHATAWLQDNVLTHPDSVLYDVDTWGGSKEKAHEEFDWSDVYQTYLSVAGERTKPFVMTSDKFFKSNKTMFDFIYVDGAHTMVQVSRDLMNANKFIKPGGIIGADDYLWGMGLPFTQRPKEAIDGFMMTHESEYDLLERGAQVWLQKR